MRTRRLREDVRTALGKLPAGRYGVVYADPPWDWMRGGTNPQTNVRGANAGRHYNTNVGNTPYIGLNTKELIALGPEIRRVAANDSHLYLWTVNKTFPDAVKILESWGYRWVTVVTWDKGRPGLAKYFQGMTEHCVFGVRGSPPYKFHPETGKMQQGRTLIEERMTDHSRKPAAMREAIEKVSRGPFLELFGRRVPKNWDAIGLELEGT